MNTKLYWNSSKICFLRQKEMEKLSFWHLFFKPKRQCQENNNESGKCDESLLALFVSVPKMNENVRLMFDNLAKEVASAKNVMLIESKNANEIFVETKQK